MPAMALTFFDPAAVQPRRWLAEGGRSRLISFASRNLSAQMQKSSTDIANRITSAGRYSRNAVLRRMIARMSEMK